MFKQYSALRRQSAWPRKLVLAVLVVLQGAISLAPLLEVSERGRIGAHAEERGAQHKYQHDEATCAVGSVRSLHSAPAQSPAAITCERHQFVAALDAPVARSRRNDPTSLPRAPPRLT